MESKWLGIIGMVMGALGILASIAVTWVSLEARISAMGERGQALEDKIVNLEARSMEGSKYVIERMDEADRYRREVMMTLVSEIYEMKGRECP